MTWPDVVLAQFQLIPAKPASPRVLYYIRLFGLGGCPMPNMRQLRAIDSPDLSGHLYVTKTLVMGNWKWRYDTCRLFVPFRELCNSGKWVSGIILNSTVGLSSYDHLCAPFGSFVHI
jgi:hypothetical protein